MPIDRTRRTKISPYGLRLGLAQKECDRPPAETQLLCVLARLAGRRSHRGYRLSRRWRRKSNARPPLGGYRPPSFAADGSVTMPSRRSAPLFAMVLLGFIEAARSRRVSSGRSTSGAGAWRSICGRSAFSLADRARMIGIMSPSYFRPEAGAWVS
jgi:hypothetical protein